MLKGLLEKLKGKKKSYKLPRVWAMVDLNDMAKEMCVGGFHNLRIYMFSGNSLIGNPEQFTEHRIKNLIKNGIPVIFRETGGKPLECQREPRRKVLFGRISWRNYSYE